MAKHNDVGILGEDIASEYLQGKGWKVVERNFRRPYGEIDIVARETGGLLVFVEVKTVSYGTAGYRPEDNVHPGKLLRLSRTIQAYLASKRHYDDWRFDVLAVFLDPVTKKAEVRHTEDIVIGS
jgi:putative endonuclease